MYTIFPSIKAGGDYFYFRTKKGHMKGAIIRGYSSPNLWDVVYCSFDWKYKYLPSPPTFYEPFPVSD